MTKLGFLVSLVLLVLQLVGLVTLTWLQVVGPFLIGLGLDALLLLVFAAVSAMVGGRR